jgi:Zn-dependent peptidase ImmA (M78 family)
MKQPTKQEMNSLMTDLRSLTPRRPLTYGESIQVARVQAARLRRWAKASDEPDLNLIWLVKQKAVPVHFVASYKLGGESGMTTDHVGGKLRVFINQGEPPVRQRFSLCHELKHVLDFEDAATLHAKLGRGYAEVQQNQIELIANEFAGHVLMPSSMVKHLWCKFQDLSLVASMFNVSVEAMAIRLERLGLIGEPAPEPRIYFRRNTLFPMIKPSEPAIVAV